MFWVDEALLDYLWASWQNIKNIKTSVSGWFFYLVAEWATDALLAIGKGAPFSLCLTEKHFSKVASACGNKAHNLATVSLPDYVIDVLAIQAFSCIWL